MLVILLALLPTLALADTPLDELPVELRARFEEAEAAWGAGEFEAAELAFAEVSETVPEFNRAWRRRCGVVLAQGRVDDAVSLCRQAVVRKNSHENRTALGIALLQTNGGAIEAGPLIKGVVSEQPDYLPGWVAQCTWADVAEASAPLQACSEKLLALAPETPGTLYYQALALADAGDVKGAGDTLRLAREKGLTDELLERAARTIAARARTEAAPPKPRANDGDWSLGDLLPLLIVGAILLAVGVLAFGSDEEEEEG